MGKTSDEAEALQLLKNLFLGDSQGRFISNLWMQAFLTKHLEVIGFDTKALRTFILHHSDNFELENNEKVKLCANSKTTMASKMKPDLRSPKDQNTSRTGSKKADDLPYLKRHVNKKENEVLHALANLVCEKRSASQVLTMSQLAASMSMLSEEHHQIIGHGQKDLQKFLQKHSDIFTVQGGTVSVKSAVVQMLKYNDELETPIITDNCLQQVLGTVTRVLEGYGFIITTNGYNVYFSANVFEGGNAQDLTNHVTVGDKVVLDAEKSGPTYAAEWRANKVRKLRRQYSSSRDSWSGSCSSLDKIDAVGNRWVSLDSLSSDISKKSSTTAKKKSSEKLTVKDRELIIFLQNRLKLKNNSLSIQNLTGHLSGLPAHLHTQISSKRDELRTYIEKHESYFHLQGDVVSLKNVQILSEDDKESNTSESSSSSNLSTEECVSKVKTKVKGKVLSTDDSGSGIIILSTGEMVQFTSSYTSFGTKKPFHPNDTVVCNVVLDRDDWKATNVWHQTSPTSETSFQSVEAPQITGFRGKILYVYPTYGIIRHGTSDDKNIYFHKDVVVSDFEVDSLGDILAIGDEVLCDAVEVTNYTCGYRALRVIPLDDKDDSFQVVSRKSTKSSSQSSDTTWATLLKGSKITSAVSAPVNATGNPLEEVYVSDDEWDTIDDGDEERLVNCSGRVVSLKQNCGFIQRGKTQSFKDPENVYFNNLAFCTEGGQKVTNLLDVLSQGETVYYDAVRGYDNASCKWRAEVVWKEGVNRRTELTINGEVLVEREGKVIKIYPSKGLISFGPHPYLDRVFFSKDVFFHNGLRHWNLAAVLKAGDTVMFDAECDVAGQNTKWKASRVWVDETSPHHHFTGKAGSARIPGQSEEFLRDREGHIAAVFPSKGVIVFGSRAYFDEVFFTVDVFYDNGCTVHNLQHALKQHDKIKFDAKVDRPEQRTKWKAELVWKGPRPNISSAAQHHFMFCDYLQPFIPDIYNSDDSEDHNVEIINTRGKTIQQIASTKNSAPQIVAAQPRRNSSDSERSASSTSASLKVENERQTVLSQNNVTQTRQATQPLNNNSTAHKEPIATAKPVTDVHQDSLNKFVNLSNESSTAGKSSSVLVIPSVSSPALINHTPDTGSVFPANKEVSDTTRAAKSSNNLDTFELGSVEESVKRVHSTEQSPNPFMTALNNKCTESVNTLHYNSGGPIISSSTVALTCAETSDVKIIANDKLVLDTAFGRTGSVIALQKTGGYISTTVGEKDKFESVQVCFSMDNFFVNGIRAMDCNLTIGETVYLNATKYLYASSNSSNWEASMVWKGRKPRLLSVSSGNCSPLEGPASPSSSVDTDFSTKEKQNVNKYFENSPAASSLSQESTTSHVVATIECPEAISKDEKMVENASQSLINTSSVVDYEMAYPDTQLETSSLAEDMALEEMISKEIEALVEPHLSDTKGNSESINLTIADNKSACETSLDSNITLGEETTPDNIELVPWEDGAPQESWISLDDAIDRQVIERTNGNFGEVMEVSELAENVPQPPAVTVAEAIKTSFIPAEKGLPPTSSEHLLAINNHLRSLWPSLADQKTMGTGVPENIPTYTTTSTAQSLPTLSGSVDFSHLWLPSQVPTTSSESLEASGRMEQDFERAWFECFDLMRYLHAKTQEMLQRTSSQLVTTANDSTLPSSGVTINNQDVLTTQPRVQTVTVATQTVFTGDVFCNTFYSGE